MFITSAYVDLALGTATRIALAPTTAGFIVFEGMARAEVQAAAQVAGYSIGNTSSNDMVKLLAVGQFFLAAGGLKKGLPPSEYIQRAIADLDLVRTGKKPIPGLSPSTEDGIGGTQFSSSSDDDTDGRVQHFSRAKLSTW